MQEITFAELDTEMVTMLPAKETLFWNTTNVAKIWASNSSAALNVLALGSQANSAALQTISVGQFG